MENLKTNNYEKKKKRVKCELYNDHFQNFKKYGIMCNNNYY